MLKGNGTEGITVCLLERGHPGLRVGDRHDPTSGRCVSGVHRDRTRRNGADTTRVWNVSVNVPRIHLAIIREPCPRALVALPNTDLDPASSRIILSKCRSAHQLRRQNVEATKFRFEHTISYPIQSVTGHDAPASLLGMLSGLVKLHEWYGRGRGRVYPARPNHRRSKPGWLWVEHAHGLLGGGAWGFVACHVDCSVEVDIYLRWSLRTYPQAIQGEGFAARNSSLLCPRWAS